MDIKEIVGIRIYKKLQKKCGGQLIYIPKNSETDFEERNKTIHLLKIENPKEWTNIKLSQKFNLTVRRITQILRAKNSFNEI